MEEYRVKTATIAGLNAIYTTTDGITLNAICTATDGVGRSTQFPSVCMSASDDVCLYACICACVSSPLQTVSLSLPRQRFIRVFFSLSLSLSLAQPALSLID